MGSYMKLGKGFNPIEHRRFGLGLLAGLLLSVTYLSPSVFYSNPFYNVDLGSPSIGSEAHPTTRIQNFSVINSTIEISSRPENATKRRIRSCEGSANNTEPCEKGGFIWLNGSLLAKSDSSDHVEEEAAAAAKSLGSFVGDTMLEEENPDPSEVDVTAMINSTFAPREDNSTWQYSGKMKESELQNLTLGEPRTNQTEMSNFTEFATNASIGTVMNINSTQQEATGSFNPRSNFGNFTGNVSPMNDSVHPSSASGSTRIIEVASKIQLLDEKIGVPKPKETKPLCDFSNRRSNVCNMQGDIRIHGKSSSVVFMASSGTDTSPRNESWKIKPYARKSDLTAMNNVRELTVKSSNTREEPPRCTLNHSVPAVVFSVGGYVGNYFHSFTDVLVPLFLTSYQFHGEVQFLVTNYHFFWIKKFLPIFDNLSKYPIIDLDNDERVHCFNHAIVGLDSHDDMRIDTWRSPNGISMLDFARFLRKAYSLPRESPVTRQELEQKKKPRLLIVARTRTRRFTNVDEIVKMARKSGFEVVVGEAGADIARFARVVNSCDVMVGVHGAGLTNSVFLPTSAALIQIVPWGSLDWICKTYFGEPSKGMKLNYLEHRIEVEESTLTELYPRDDPVLKAPETIHGWNNVSDIFLTKQNVKLNVRRFRPVLMKALQLLRDR